MPEQLIPEARDLVARILEGDPERLRHKPHRRSGQGVWGTPQRWRKSTEGCRMA